MAITLVAAPARPPDPWLSKMAAAHGGAKSLEELTGLDVTLDGRVDYPLQAQRFLPPYEPLPLHAAFRADFRDGRSAVDYRLVFSGGYTINSRELATDRTVSLDLISNTYTVEDSPSLRGLGFRYHPLFLLKALARPNARIEDAGETTFASEAALRLKAQGPGLPAGLEIYVAKTSGILLGYSFPRADALDPHARCEGEYRDYRRHDGWLVPRAVSITWTATPKTGIEVELVRQVINPAFGADTFVVPRDAKRAPSETAAGPFVRDLGGDLYLVEHLAGDDYHALVMVFDEYIAVMEAPLDMAAGAQLLEIAKSLAPTKPLRYLVLSHHHDDHVGGFPAFLKDDPVVITPAGAIPWLKHVARAASVGAEVRFEAVGAGKSRELRDAHHRVEIVSLGQNPHSEDLLLLHAPKERMVYQVDLLSADHVQQRSQPLNEGGLFLAKWLTARGWPVERLVGSHGVIATPNELDFLLGKAGSPLRFGGKPARSSRNPG